MRAQLSRTWEACAGLNRAGFRKQKCSCRSQKIESDDSGLWNETENTHLEKKASWCAGDCNSKALESQPGIVIEATEIFP